MVFDILDILFLPPLFFIGIITSYEDFKFGKIKNKWIVLGLAWGMGVYFLIAILNLIGYNGIFSSVIANSLFNHNWTNLIGDVLLNSFCSFFLGFLLWRFGLWSAGDAKLFFVFSLLLPLKYYFNGYLFIFPSSSLFINTLLGAFLFLLILSFMHLIKLIFIKSFKLKLGNLFNKKEIKFKTSLLAESILKKVTFPLTLFFNSILILMSAFLIARMIMEKFQNLPHFNANIFSKIVILGLIIFSKPLMKFSKNFRKIIIIFLATYFFCIILFFPLQIKPVLFFVLRMITMFSVFFIFLIILPLFYIKRSINKNMPFAIWLTIGAIITIFLRSSILHLFL